MFSKKYAGRGSDQQTVEHDWPERLTPPWLTEEFQRFSEASPEGETAPP
jgi:hypothetical protein